jgi:uroporphyrin-III C-methyltransferase
MTMNHPTGSVTLVGAGPGDPELLTIQAVRAIRQATVLLVDDLVDDGVLRYARRCARIVHVGKRGGGFCAPRPSPATAVPQGERRTLGRPGGAMPAPRPSPATAVPQGERRTLGRPGGSPSTPQSFIHKLMIAEARRGERVVRLKGGDPFVFGRGGEECDALREAGIEVSVVSGLTAGIAGPAAIGLPVTDRRHAQGVALVTGHARDGGAAPDWPALVRCGLTLVIYMGIARVDEIQRALLDAGMAPDMPAAVVSQACTPLQRHALCALDTLADTVRDGALASPAVLVIGRVVHSIALPELLPQAAVA